MEFGQSPVQLEAQVEIAEVGVVGTSEVPEVAELAWSQLFLAFETQIHVARENLGHQTEGKMSFDPEQSRDFCCVADDLAAEEFVDLVAAARGDCETLNCTPSEQLGARVSLSFPIDSCHTVLA